MASKRQIIMLESSAGTGFRYYTTKNKQQNFEKMKIMKYDPKVRKHVEFVEKKLPSHNK